MDPDDHAPSSAPSSVPLEFVQRAEAAQSDRHGASPQHLPVLSDDDGYQEDSDDSKHPSDKPCSQEDLAQKNAQAPAISAEKGPRPNARQPITGSRDRLPAKSEPAYSARMPPPQPRLSEAVVQLGMHETTRPRQEPTTHPQPRTNQLLDTAATRAQLPPVAPQVSRQPYLQTEPGPVAKPEPHAKPLPHFELLLQQGQHATEWSQRAGAASPPPPEGAESWAKQTQSSGPFDTSPNYDDERTALLPGARAGDSVDVRGLQAVAPNYGGTKVEPLWSEEGSRLDREADGDEFDQSYEFDEDAYEGSTTEEWMRAGSEESPRQYMEGEGERAAFILGTGSSVVLAVVLAVVLSGVSSWLEAGHAPDFEVFSEWEDMGQIPLRFGCFAEGGAGAALSIPVRWRNAPAGTTSVVLLLANPGSIEDHGTDPVHWFLTNIHVVETGNASASQAREQAGQVGQAQASWIIPANASRNPDLLPSGTVEKHNSVHSSGAYVPLCTKHAAPSLYILYVYALVADPVINSFSDARQIMHRLSGVPFAKLAGYYGRSFGG